MERAVEGVKATEGAGADEVRHVIHFAVYTLQVAFTPSTT